MVEAYSIEGIDITVCDLQYCLLFFYVKYCDKCVFSADDASAGFVNGSHVMLQNTGVVTSPAQVSVRSTCDVDMTYFPFDDQLCALRFGSWLYSDQSVRFNVCYSCFSNRLYSSFQSSPLTRIL